MRYTALFAVVLLAGCALGAEQKATLAAQQTDSDARLAKALAGLTPGRPQSCIQPRFSGSSERIGNTILYRVDRDLIYRNDTNGGCNSSSTLNDSLIVRSFGAQTCRGDIVRTVDLISGIQTGSCALGDFVPYRRQR